MNWLIKTQKTLINLITKAYCYDNIERLQRCTISLNIAFDLLLIIGLKNFISSIWIMNPTYRLRYPIFDR